MVTLEITVNKLVAGEHRKSMTGLPKTGCNDFPRLAEIDGKADDKAGLAHESCQTALSMTQMKVVSSLAQLVYREAATQPKAGASPFVCISSESTCASERSASAPTSSSPAATVKIQMCSQVRMCRPRSGGQQSPSKVPSKAKWNSDVRCKWPPCPRTSPTRLGEAAATTPRRLTSTPEVTAKNVGVMTFPAINAGDLIKKVEALEIELDVHVCNERQLLTINEQLRERLEVCLRELNDAGMMNVQLDNLNDEMEKILQLLRHLSKRNAVLEKEKSQVQAKLEREAALNKLQPSQMQPQIEDHDIDLCDAECQTICSCQQVDTRKRRRERKRWLEAEETPVSNQLPSRPLSPTQLRKANMDPQF